LSLSKCCSEPPPPSTGVQYRIDDISLLTGFTIGDVRAINNYGMVVITSGSPQDGFLYDHANNIFYDLNSLTSLTNQLDAYFGEVGGTFASATAINDLGYFIGTVTGPDYPAAGALIRAYAIQTTLSVDPQDWTVVVLPDLGSNETTGSDINLAGDVLAQYRRGNGTWDYYIYNPWLDSPGDEITLEIPNLGSWGVINNYGQVAGNSDSNNQFVFDSNSGTFQWFAIPDGFVRGLNDAGVFAGNSGNEFIFRDSHQLSQTEIVYTVARNESVGMAGLTQGINENGDVLFVKSGGKKGGAKAYFAHTGFTESDPDQILKLDDLIAPDDPLRDYWIANGQELSGMSDRTNIDDATGYPQFAGKIRERFRDGSQIYTGVILTPFIPDP